MIIHPEVQAALADGRAVVALESTIITHGMPFPENVETALAVEGVIRHQGAVPATIAIVDGSIRIGLGQDEIERLGQARDVLKTSRRDLAYVTATGRSGATTVAGTMILARRAGIPVFVTGGIGGVHRGATETMDVSADLSELGRTDVAVVCAGVKSILDVGLTLEVLETHGVPVLGFQTDRFPAFYLRDSGFAVDYRLDSAAEAAAVIARQRRLGLQTGLVIANPIPEAHALAKEEIEPAIRQALDEAASLGIHGKAITPYLLGKLTEITLGRSLKANIALVKHNAHVGAAIARELSHLEKQAR